MITGLSPARGGGALKQGADILGLRFTFTTGTGAVAGIVGSAHTQFALSNFTAGVATLTFPKSLAYLDGFGEADADSATAANRRLLLVKNVNRNTGTAVVRLVLDSDGSTDTTHTLGTGEIRLTLIVGE